MKERSKKALKGRKIWSNEYRNMNGHFQKCFVCYLLWMVKCHSKSIFILQRCENSPHMLRWIVFSKTLPFKNCELYIHSMSLAEILSKNLIKYFSCLSVVRWVEDLLKKATRWSVFLFFYFLALFQDPIFQSQQNISWGSTQYFFIALFTIQSFQSSFTGN